MMRLNGISKWRPKLLSWCFCVCYQGLCYSLSSVDTSLNSLSISLIDIFLFELYPRRRCIFTLTTSVPFSHRNIFLETEGDACTKYFVETRWTNMTGDDVSSHENRKMLRKLPISITIIWGQKYYFFGRPKCPHTVLNSVRESHDPSEILIEKLS